MIKISIFRFLSLSLSKKVLSKETQVVWRRKHDEIRVSRRQPMESSRHKRENAFIQNIILIISHQPYILSLCIRKSTNNLLKINNNTNQQSIHLHRHVCFDSSLLLSRNRRDFSLCFWRFNHFKRCDKSKKMIETVRKIVKIKIYQNLHHSAWFLPWISNHILIL